MAIKFDRQRGVSRQEPRYMLMKQNSQALQKFDTNNVIQNLQSKYQSQIDKQGESLHSEFNRIKEKYFKVEKNDEGKTEDIEDYWTDAFK